MLEKCRLSGFADEIDSSLLEQIKVLKSLNQKYIELRSADGRNVADFTNEEAVKIERILDAEGIKVSAIGSPIGKIGITDDFEPHFKTYKHVVELAKIFKTKYIRIFSFYIPTDKNPDGYKDEVLTRMKRFVDYAVKENVILLHENEKEIYGDSGERCLTLMQEFYGDNFQCTFDFANFVQCNEDVLSCYEKLKPYIKYIHIKDALYKGGVVVPAGKGDGQLEKILRELDESHFEGFLSLEPHLTDFDGLNSLEKNVAEKKMKDQKEAYRIAHDALFDLLKK